MRVWTAVVVCTWMTGCVVYRDDLDAFHESTWSSTSDDTTWVDPEGQVEVSWRVGSAGCEAAAIETVEVDLGGRVTSFPCADEGAVLDAPLGRSPLTLRGFDAEGIARYEGDGGKVRVRGGEVTLAPTVVLSALPATIRATWYFENGRLCVPNGVDAVEATLFDLDDTLHASVTANCDEGALRVDDVEPGTWVLLLLGRNGDGEVVYDGEAEVEARPGDDLDLDVMLVSEL